MKSELVLELLKEKMDHSAFVVKTWSGPDGSEPDSDTMLEIYFQNGYQAGLQTAITLIEKYLVDEKADTHKWTTR